MKKSCLLVNFCIALLFFITTPTHAILVSAGDSFRVDFDFSATPGTPPYEQVTAAFNMGTDLWDPGDGFDVRLYDSAENLLSSYTSLNQGTNSLIGFSQNFNPSTPLTVQSGYILYDNILGSFDITLFQLRGYTFQSSTFVTDTGFVEFPVTVTSVPIPPALWLFSSGLLGLIGISRRKKAA